MVAKIKMNPAALTAVLTEATDLALTRAAIQVQNEARRLCPVDTGRLRASINFSIAGASPETTVCRVGTNVEYAYWVETGTGVYGPHNTPVVPQRASHLVFTVGGRKVFVQSVKGREATPFLAPALLVLGGTL